MENDTQRIVEELYIAEMQNEAVKSSYKRRQRIYEEIEQGGNIKDAYIME